MPSQRLVVLGMCAIALLVGAFAAPVGAPPTPDDPTLDPREDFDDSDGGIDDSERDDDSIGDGPSRSPGCKVALSNRPVAGQPITLAIQDDGVPASGVAVFLNGDLVGRTDERGTIRTTVPYASELRVAVVGPVTSCQFELEPDENELQSSVQPLALGGTAGWFHPQTPDAPLMASVAPAGTTTDEAGGTGTVLQVDPDRATENSTYGVLAHIRIRHTGQPYPGNTVTLNATIAGNPVPDAAVILNGKQVGTTNERGRYVLTVPENANELSVVVERGELRQSEEINVLRPALDVSTATVLPTPGESATVRVTFGGRPMTGVPVSIGTTRLGTTDDAGTLQITLPDSYLQSIRVDTTKGSDAHPLAFLYAPTVFVGGFLTFVLGGFVVLAYSVGVRRTLQRAGGTISRSYTRARRGELSTAARRTIARLGSTLSLALSVLFGYQLAGELGGVYGLAAGVALATAVFVTARPERLSSTVMASAGVVDRVAKRLWGVIHAITTLLRVGIGRIPDWLRTALTHLRHAVGSPWMLPRRLWVTLLLAGTVLRSLPSRLSRSGDGNQASSSGGAVEPPSAEPPMASEQLTIRDYWRRFAKRVAPERWPTQTPAELARTAVASGYPREPVMTLTALFRARAYGNVDPSPDNRERVRSAFAALADDEDEDDSPPDGEVSDS
jgi:hypothetical protein